MKEFSSLFSTCTLAKWHVDHAIVERVVFTMDRDAIMIVRHPLGYELYVILKIEPYKNSIWKEQMNNIRMNIQYMHCKQQITVPSEWILVER